MQEETKTCLQCNKPLRGRSDKKFCDDYCRNNYNNQLKAHSNNYVRNVNNALGKNRRILEECLSETEETKKITKEKLTQLGFSFNTLRIPTRTKKVIPIFFVMTMVTCPSIMTGI